MNLSIRSLRPRRRQRKRDAAREHAPKALLVATGAALAGLARFFDKRRRRMARDKTASAVGGGAEAAAGAATHAANVAKGAAHEAKPSGEREYDDVTLARKVESELFRPADAPKGAVDVNVHDGTVELRGTVASDERSAELAAAAEKVDGVDEVKNLLKVGGSEET